MTLLIADKQIIGVAMGLYRLVLNQSAAMHLGGIQNAG
jgi:hypothetical protein